MSTIIHRSAWHLELECPEPLYPQKNPVCSMTTLNMSTQIMSNTAKVWFSDLSAFFVRPYHIFREYRLEYLQADIMAGLTVAIVMLPQAIAYALIAELPPQMGLYTAIVSAIIAALWGSSIHLHSGPTNASSLLTLSTLLAVATPGSPEYLVAAGLLAVLVGVIRLLLGLAHLGVIVNFISDSVIIGFTAGAGILISLNQLRPLMRLDFPSNPSLYSTLQEVGKHIGETHWPSMAIGLGAIFLIAILGRYRPKWPGALISMVLASIFVVGLNLDKQGVVVLGELPRSLPPLAPVSLFDWDLISALSPGAVAIAAIGLVEAMSIARSIATQSGQRLNSNQEFVGQGLSNLVAGIFSGYPGSGSFTRSAVNYVAGAKTSLASVFSGLWVLSAMLIFAPYAVYIPRAALAGVLIITAYGMVDRKEIKRIWQASRGDSAILVATILATLILPLQFAVLSGIIVSVLRFLVKTSTPEVYPVVPDEDFRHFVEVEDRSVCPQMGIILVSGSLYFGAAHHVEKVIHANMEAYPEQQFLLLRMHLVDHCDVSGIHMLEAVVRLYRRRHGDVYISGLRKPLREQMHLIGFDVYLGQDHFLPRHSAIDHMFHKILEPSICIYVCEKRVFAECQALPKQPTPSESVKLQTFPDHKIRAWRPSELKDLLAKKSVIMIDVREPFEYQNGHIAQSQLIPLRLIRQQGTMLPKDQPLMLLCRVGRRSRLAASILMDLGYQDVHHLEGGILAWEAAGYPLAVE